MALRTGAGATSAGLVRWLAAFSRAAAAVLDVAMSGSICGGDCGNGAGAMVVQQCFPVRTGA